MAVIFRPQHILFHQKIRVVLAVAFRILPPLLFQQFLRRNKGGFHPSVVEPEGAAIGVEKLQIPLLRAQKQGDAVVGSGNHEGDVPGFDPHHAVGAQAVA